MPIENRNLQPGTRLVGRYHKQPYVCEVVEGEGGKLRYRLEDGREFNSPSAAGMAITGHACDGWVFWSVDMVTTTLAPQPEPAEAEQEVKVDMEDTDTGNNGANEVAAMDTLGMENSIARSRTLAYLAQVALRTLEVGDLEKRIVALEQSVRPQRGQHPAPALDLGVCPSNRMTKEVGYNEGNLNRGVVYEQDIPSLRARPAVPDACINAGLATQRSSGLFCLGCGGKLDLSAVTERYAHEERGYPPYHPQLMVKVLLYAYCIGVPSSRKIARKLEEDIAFRVLAANNTPDFRTISDFRKDHLKSLAGLFVQVLKLCQKAGLVKLGHVALDGTKIQANASKHKAMSYKRMKEEETRVNNHQH